MRANPSRKKHPPHSVSAGLIDYRLRIAERLGGDRRRILGLAGVSAAELADPEDRVPLEKERALWRAMREETGREDVGLECGLHFPVQAMGLIGYVMMNASSVRKAIESFCRFQRLVGETMGMRVAESDGYADVLVELWSPWYDELRYTTDVFLGATLSWVASNAASQPRPLRVGFHYRQPSNVDDYRRVFAPAPVEFGCEVSYLTYRSSALEEPVISANARMFDHFAEQLTALYDRFEGRSTYTWKAKQLILEKMLGEVPGLEDVASELAVSSRTLQKALKEEGTSFRKLLEEVRQEAAEDHLLKGTLSVSEIAYLLGYSEVSAFSRSFKKWTGRAPTEYAAG